MVPVKFELPDIANESLKPLAQSIGGTLSSIWNMCFGWVNISSEKIQYRRQQDLQRFKDELDKKISAIPEEKLCEPKISVIGPALEASKFFFEEDSLRKMFANLIANSLNLDTADYIQTSFVEIIKQMSPVDAALFSILVDEKLSPIAEIKEVAESGGKFTLIPYLYYDDIRGYSLYKENAVSLINLQRLGLISITFREYFTNATYYDRYHIDEFSAYEIAHGVIKITPYGEAFVKVCL